MKKDTFKVTKELITNLELVLTDKDQNFSAEEMRKLLIAKKILEEKLEPPTESIKNEVQIIEDYMKAFLLIMQVLGDSKVQVVIKIIEEFARGST